MGKILKVNKLTTFAEAIILVFGVGIILGSVYYFAPGLRVQGSVASSGIDVTKDDVNNVKNSPLLELPSSSLSSDVKSKPKVRIAGYAWSRVARRVSLFL